MHKSTRIYLKDMRSWWVFFVPSQLFFSCLPASPCKIGNFTVDVVVSGNWLGPLCFYLVRWPRTLLSVEPKQMIESITPNYTYSTTSLVPIFLLVSFVFSSLICLDSLLQLNWCISVINVDSLNNKITRKQVFFEELKNKIHHFCL
jgi:hypothetical protein